MPQAIRITAENVEDLIDWGKSVQMNLTHLRQEVEPEFPALGPNYLIADGSVVQNNVTCTVMSEASFYMFWKFVDKELPFTHFNEIEKV